MYLNEHIDIEYTVLRPFYRSDIRNTVCAEHADSPLQDAAPHTDMWTRPGVVVAEKDRDTPSEGDYMGGKLKT